MPPQTSNKYTAKTSKGRLAALLLLLVIIVACLAVTHQQAIYDWARLRGYTPPAQISQLVSADKLTAGAQHVLYVNHPTVEDKNNFAAVCPNGGKEAAVLGCYVPDQRGIYVLSVADPTLAGIEQVTLAHELLHAEYDRLDSATKNQVDGWLMDYYRHGLHDATIIEQMNTYKKTEPAALVDEMHSVFGSEVANLPSNLENYYQRYFQNRAIITGYYGQYEDQFTTRLNQIKQDDAQLAEWKSQIDSLESDAKDKQAALLAAQQQLDAYRSSGNIAAYNYGVSAYNAQVSAYNSEVQSIHTLVSQYNSLVAARNAIALEEQQLVQDISSSTTPISK